MSKSASSFAQKAFRAASESVDILEPMLLRMARLESALIASPSDLRVDAYPAVRAAYAAARRENLQLREDAFLRSAPEEILAHIRRQVGEEGLVLMRSNDPEEIFQVYARMCLATRYRHFDADGGIRLTETLSRLDDAAHQALWERIRRAGFPPPMGIRPPRGGVMTWSSHGQPYFWMNFAFAVLNRGRQVLLRLGPINRMVGKGPHQLAPADLHKPAHGMLNHTTLETTQHDPSTMHDMILAARGFAPIDRGVILRDSDLGPRPAKEGERLCWELVLQLTRLTGDVTWLDARGQELSDKIKALRDGGRIDSYRPTDTGKRNNPHTDLTAEDCCKMLMEEPDAPRVIYNTLEIEHSLGQRVARLFDRICRWLRVPEQAGDFNKLNGVFDPANLRAVSPMMHFMVDGMAAYFYGALFNGIFAPTSKRLGKIKDGSNRPATIVPGRPYLEHEDPRQSYDYISELEAAVEQERLPKTKRPKREVTVTEVAARFKKEARKVTANEKLRNTLVRMAAALEELDARREAGQQVRLEDYLEAIKHGGADRVRNAFVAVDAGPFAILLEMVKGLPHATTAPEGYPRNEVERFFRAIADRGKELGYDVSDIETKFAMPVPAR